MRFSRAVLRCLSAGLLAFLFVLLAVLPARADTGTYRISDYRVTLEPQPDGQVRITYVQDWRVLSGDIPWVTVGLPNQHFAVENQGGAAAKVAADNGGGFTGVRVDLDKDYQPGQTFQITFTVLQNNILERLTSDKQWRLNFTPGWYDRATIDHLVITLVSPVAFESYTNVSPMPSSVTGNNVVWESGALSPGSRMNFVTMSADGSFLQESVPVGNSGGGISSWTKLLIGAAVVIVVGLLIAWGIRKNREAIDNRNRERIRTVEQEMQADKQKRQEVQEGFDKYVKDQGIRPDAQGRYYDRGYGDYITPAIWGAIIGSQISRSNNPPPNTGGFRSCVSCACVSCACACACACAGGGAAGCSRKTLHECPACNKPADRDASAAAA